MRAEEGRFVLLSLTRLTLLRDSLHRMQSMVGSLTWERYRPPNILTFLLVSLQYGHASRLWWVIWSKTNHAWDSIIVLKKTREDLASLKILSTQRNS